MKKAMIKKQLKKAIEVMNAEKCNNLRIELTPFSLTKIDKEKYAITAGNTVIVDGKLNELSSKFDDNLFIIIPFLIETIVDFKLNNNKKEVNNE